MDKSDLLRDMVKSRPLLEKIHRRVTDCVRESFASRRRSSGIVLPSEVVTDTEIRRRVNICFDWFMRLRQDCGYSAEKALDHLGLALSAELDGTDFEPPPADGAWGVPNA